MKKLATVSFCLLLAIEGLSQELIVSQADFKKGIYKSFEEFKYNNPSIELKNEITAKSRKLGILDKDPIIFYRIDISKKEGKMIGEVYGFSDGKYVYINESMPKLGPKTEFSKIEYIGEYCYFKDIYCTSTYNGMTTITTCDLDEKLIEMETGKVIRLSKRSLRELLANDTELLDKFNNESLKNKKLKEYVIRYIEKTYP